MKRTSDAAKAASILHHTWGVPDYATALAIYDELAEGYASVENVLDKHDAGVWDALATMPHEDWWENVECLALSIDAARDYYATKGESK